MSNKKKWKKTSAVQRDSRRDSKTWNRAARRWSVFGGITR